MPLALLLTLAFLLPASVAHGDSGARKTVVVVGGGYGGIEAASRLAKDASLRVLLLDKATHHTEVTRLHESASKNKALQHDLAAIARQKGFEFRPAEVTGLALDQKIVQTKGGPLRYDSVIVAIGGETAWPKVPGLRKHGMGLRTPWEAKRIRTAVNQRLAEAAKATDPKQRKALARIVVAGAGATGVELAAELAQAAPTLAAQHGLQASDISVHIVQRGKELLSKNADLKPSDRQEVKERLKKMGVVVHTGSTLTKLDNKSMTLEVAGQRTRLDTKTVIWAGGVKASSAAAAWGLPIGQQGRIQVDSSLRIVGAKGAYAIGDSAGALHPKNGGMVGMTAQEAKSQAKVAAKNIGFAKRGKTLLAYKPKAAGTLVSLGNRDGVGRVFGIRIRGRFAALMKRGIEYKHRRALRSRARIMPRLWKAKKVKPKLKTARAAR